MMKAEEVIKRCYVDSIPREQTTVGVEIELPLVSMGNRPVALSFIRELAHWIAQRGFLPVRFTEDGDVCEWSNCDGDVCSFETSWNTLELSMKNGPDLTLLAGRFCAVLIPLQEFCMGRGYYLCGRGLNPNCGRLDPAPLKTAILQAKSQFLSTYTEHHDGEIFHAICASVQTHLDACDSVQYMERFALLRRAYVFDAALFANSPPPGEEFLRSRPSLRGTSRDTLCYRDELWKCCGAPNIVADPVELKDTGALCSYLARLKLFIEPDGDGYKAIAPVPLYEYLAQPGHDETALRCFRSLEPVAPTKSGSMEIRSTCTQPLDGMFAPSAFYLGLVENLAAARRKVDEIYSRYFPGDTPYQVREKLVRRSNRAQRDMIRDDVTGLVEISLKGLARRGLGEERFLLSLKAQLEQGISPPDMRADGEGAMLDTQVQMSNIKREYGYEH